jgi:hypothetical protein
VLSLLGPLRGRGGSGTTFSESFAFGKIELDYSFDYSTRTAIIQEKKVELKSDNVVLVDRVDTASERAIVGTLRVADTIDDDRRIEPVLNSSPQILEFLRCDIRLDEPGRDAAVQRICAMILGK